KATSNDGFAAEWRVINLLMVDGDLVRCCEVFDEDDVDHALARFRELCHPSPKLENDATKAEARSFENFNVRNWNAEAEVLAFDSYVDDRRRVVNVGHWSGREVVIASLQALAEGPADRIWTAVATRGQRLALTRISSRNSDPHQGEFGVEILNIVE